TPPVRGGPTARPVRTATDGTRRLPGPPGRRAIACVSPAVRGAGRAGHAPSFPTTCPSAVNCRRAVLVPSGVEARERLGAGVPGGVPKHLLDAQQLVVLGHALRAGRGAGLDLATIAGHGEVGDGRVLGLAG